MATSASISDFYKLSTTPGTAVALGARTVKFNTVTFYGFKADGVVNTNDVKFRPVGGTGWLTVSPGSSKVVTAPNGSFYRADQFEIDVTTSGDGVYAICGAAIIYEGP